MEQDSKIFVAGHRGMVGAAICRRLEEQGCTNIITRTRSELDLCDQMSVREFMQQQKPDYVILAAAKVGGIFANNEYPAEFIYQNLMIESNVIHQSYEAGVTKLLFLGSSCIYPKSVEQPMQETALLADVLEPTNEPYAIAKIAGIKLCESYNRQYGTDYRSVMPTNLYGIGDNFHLENSHVIPGLMRRIHDAKENNENEVTVWGSGKPMREFLYVDDMAEASLHVLNIDRKIYQKHTQPMLSHINVGTGIDCTIRELAETIQKIVGYQGTLIFDSSKPDGTLRKLMNIDRLKQLGWEPTTSLEVGLQTTYEWFLNTLKGKNGLRL